MNTLIVVPCLNEERRLEGVLAGLCNDPGAADALIVVADGGSSDQSQAIVASFAARDPRVRLLRNERRIQSAGVNAAMQQYGREAKLLIRVDAHARYPADYCAKLIEAQTQTGADCVVVSMVSEADGSSWFQTAAAAAQNSVLGAGGSPHRRRTERIWVDHGHHALMTVAAYDGAGGYDETFTHNEDAELDARILANGGRILLAGDVVIGYYPRRSARALWRQYFGYGAGRARTMLRHKARFKLRQGAPLAVAPVAAIALLAPLSPWFALPAATWLGACFGWGAAIGLKQGGRGAVWAGLPAAVMHLAWSAGYWTRLVGALFSPDADKAAPSRLGGEAEAPASAPLR